MVGSKQATVTVDDELTGGCQLIRFNGLDNVDAQTPDGRLQVRQDDSLQSRGHSEQMAKSSARTDLDFETDPPTAGQMDKRSQERFDLRST